MYKKGQLKKKKIFVKVKHQIDEKLNLIHQSLISQIKKAVNNEKDDW